MDIPEIAMQIPENLVVLVTYHPQMTSQMETTNQMLEQYLRCFLTFSQDDWVTLLPLAEFAYNNCSLCHPTVAILHQLLVPPILFPESPVPAMLDMMNSFISNNKL